MKRVIPVLIFLVVACSAEAQVDIAGEWYIIATSTTYGFQSTARGVILQNGGNISGTFALSGSPCATTGSFTGTVAGATLTVNVNENGQIVVLTGTIVTNIATGNYTAPVGGCTAGDRGTWVGRRLAVINPGGVVNGASFGTQAPAAGSIASLFGLFLTNTTRVAENLPLPTDLAASRVLVNGRAAPLFFASPTQMNFQIPWEMAGLNQVTIEVYAQIASGRPLAVLLLATGPGIFSINSQGTGQGAIQIANTAIFAAPTGSIPGAEARPVKHGEYLTIYCTGLGSVTNRPASGGKAPSDPLSNTTLTPEVSVGGLSVPVSFSGLSPGFVGLYQINVQVTASVPSGSAVPLVFTIGGRASNTVTIAVE